MQSVRHGSLPADTYKDVGALPGGSKKMQFARVSWSGPAGDLRCSVVGADVPLEGVGAA